MTWREEAKNKKPVEDRPDHDITIKKKKKHKHNICPALECLLCVTRFAREDILNGTYNIETFICSYCYAKMQRKTHVRSCFGKPTFIHLNGKQDLGYNPEAKECRDLCPDRKVCQQIVVPSTISTEVCRK